ncbi:hypothetical protein SNE40_011454 [Patella caerulea]|uniref:Uncharacterized protein n=1 Tax=Patella caerulea TaxID=87958 RepID=A0AAN8PPD3_PATCE
MNARYKRQRSSMPVEAEIFEEMFGPLIMKLDVVCESLNIVRATLEAEFKNAVDFTTFRTHTMTYPQFMNVTGPPTIPIGFVTGAPQSRNGQMKKRLLDVLYKYLA